jgi:hypothetical protein
MDLFLNREKYIARMNESQTGNGIEKVLDLIQTHAKM